MQRHNELEPQANGCDIVKFMGLTLLAALLLGLLPGCARFSTRQVDTTYGADGKKLRETSTKASSTALIDSKSALTKFRAYQSDKSQSATVGSLQSETSSTNMVKGLEHIENMMKMMSVP